MQRQVNNLSFIVLELKVCPLKMFSNGSVKFLWRLDAFRGKYGDKWITAYKEAKVSINKMGPEAKYKAVRRSSGVDSRASTQLGDLNETSSQMNVDEVSETAF